MNHLEVGDKKGVFFFFFLLEKMCPRRKFDEASFLSLFYLLPRIGSFSSGCR